MLRLLILSCLPYLLMVHGKIKNDTELLHFILREQASMIKHCMSNVCTRNMFNPHRPVRPLSKMVAFSAYSANTQSISSNTKIVLEKTRTNIGKAYDTTTGIFTAPVEGVYAFHWTIAVPRGKTSLVFIQVNGNKEAALYGYANGYSNYYSPSQSYVTHLNKGVQVNLFSASSGGSIYGTYSTFTGYKV